MLWQIRLFYIPTDELAHNHLVHSDDWTVQYIAMRALGDPDAFPAAGLGIIKALKQGDERPTPKQILKRAEYCRPWRAYAAIYLWHR